MATTWSERACASYFNDLWQVGHEVRRSRIEIARLHLKLGDFRQCRKMCQQLMALPSTAGGTEEESDIDEVEKLHQQVVDRVMREGKIGLAAVTAIVLVLGGLLFLSRRPSSKSSKK